MATTTRPMMEPSNTRRRRLPNFRMAQNFHLVWLDRSIDAENDEDCRSSITKLRQIVNTINTFTNANECIDFINDASDQQIFMIVSQELSQSIIPVVQHISQVSCVYILHRNKIEHEECMQQWSKVKGVYTDIASVFEILKQSAKDCDHNSLSISFIKTTDRASTQSLGTLDQSYMYTQILKEILLTIDFDQTHINDFLTYYRVELAENTTALKNVETLVKEYRHHEPIWWYTYDSFLYSMVNRALRLMDVDLIIKMGFFVRDLHQHIAKLHIEQFSGRNNADSFTVYRGQGLSQTVLDQLKTTQGGLISFNNFLSTSLDRAVSHAYAESNQYNSDLICVLFEININPSIPSSPFANVRTASRYEGEEEILFSMHSIFRIGQVKQMNGNTRLWQVNLTLTSDNDHQLYALTKSIKEETRGSTGWHRLGELMIKLGHFNKAEELCSVLLNQPINQGRKADLYHVLGSVYYNMGEYSKALSYYEKALEIKQKTLLANHPNLATYHKNIGLVYDNMGQYSQALSYYAKALESYQKTLPTNHPDLATSYNNIGTVYYNMGEYSKALSYYEKDFEILQKALPVNHPDLATSHSNIGSVYYNMGEYSKALSYYEKALEIRQKTLPAKHPDLATSYNNIGTVYYNMGEYSKTLSYYEKALKIYQKTLPANHPLSATSYNNIGTVYYNMGEYSKARSYYTKALEIYQKTLPTKHPLLATCDNNIGGVYYKMGRYLHAFSYYVKAFKIYQKTLPANHPSLATCCNNIGTVYYNMREYSNALSYYAKALEIYQKALPANHPHLEMVKKSIDCVKTRL